MDNVQIDRTEYAFPVLPEEQSRRARTVCFTGHRSIPSEELHAVEKRLERVLLALGTWGCTDYAVGGALGFDTMAARGVILLKRAFPEIRLHLVLPCRGQSRSWDERAKAEYESILGRADDVEYVSEKYTPYCMMQRNRRLADVSGICVHYKTKDTGGTAYTVKYARSKGLRLIGVASDAETEAGLAAERAAWRADETLKK